MGCWGFNAVYQRVLPCSTGAFESRWNFRAVGTSLFTPPRRFAPSAQYLHGCFPRGVALAWRCSRLAAHGSQSPRDFDSAANRQALGQFATSGGFQAARSRRASGAVRFFLMDDEHLRQFAAGSPLNTDNHTVLEYRAARALLSERLDEVNRREILLRQKNVLPQELSGELRDSVLAAAAITSINLQDKDASDRFLHALEGGPATMQIEMARGRVALAHENFTEALRAFNTVLALAPGTIPALWGRGEAYRRFGDAPSARVDLLRVLQQDSKNLQALESLKQVAIENSQWNEAAATERRIIDASPQSSASDYAQLAEMLLRAGNVKDAYDAMQACLARDPYNLQTRLSLACGTYSISRRTGMRRASNSNSRGAISPMVS